MRLIDADELTKVRFHGYPEIEITPSDVNAEAYKRGWNDAIDAVVESAPTIEAEPVKHGQWKPYPIADDCWQCSVCGILRMSSQSNYCPSCGAKMDEVEE